MASMAAKASVNISFSGCGFLGMYHVGSLARLKDGQLRGDDLFEVRSALGASAGALVAAAYVLDIPAQVLRDKMHEVAERVRNLGFLGPFHPGFDAVDLFQQELEVLLPDDAHQKASGKLFVSLTDATMTNVIVSRFLNRKDLKDALVCSCYLPAFSSYKQVPTYQDKPYLDGGFSNNQPVVDDANTIRVSPFAGGSHISPVDGPEVRPFLTRFGKEPIQLSASNMKRLYDAMMPPTDLEGLFKMGYSHTDDFLNSQKFSAFLNRLPTLKQSDVKPPDDRTDHDETKTIK